MLKGAEGRRGGDIAPVKKNVIIGSPHGTGGRRRFFSLFAPGRRFLMRLIKKKVDERVLRV